MDTPLQVTFRNFEHTPDLDQFIRLRAGELEAAAGHKLTSCHVVVDLAAEQHAEKRVFHARIDLAIPGGAIAVGREPHDHHSHEDAFVAVRDAFEAARRQVTDWERKHHGSP
jgi:hypothetical protein